MRGECSLWLTFEQLRVAIICERALITEGSPLELRYSSSDGVFWRNIKGIPLVLQILMKCVPLTAAGVSR